VSSYDKSKVETPIQKMILKDNSIVKLLNLSFRHHSTQKLKIKLEIDSDPPAGARSELRFLDFPLAASVEVHDLSSSFAGKSHALLCRKYVKGRDWYDFLWYVARETSLNFLYLSNALNQQGPFAGQEIEVTAAWYLKALEEKIRDIDWKKVAADVAPFLTDRDRKTLNLWGIPFFLDRLEKLEKTLKA
jgi:hypothetical protein